MELYKVSFESLRGRLEELLEDNSIIKVKITLDEFNKIMEKYGQDIERSIVEDSWGKFKNAFDKFGDNFEEIVKDWSESLNCDKKLFYYKKGCILYDIEDYEGSQKAYSIFINFINKELLLGTDLENTIDYLKEINAKTEKLLEIKGKVSFQLGLANYKLKNFINASENFKEAINSSYYDKEILAEIVGNLEDCFEKGFFLYHLKRYDEAIQVFKKSNEKTDEITFYKALSLYELKKLDESFNNFNSLAGSSSLVADSENEIIAKSWYYKGLILSELRNRKNLPNLPKCIKNSDNQEITIRDEEKKEFLKLKESKKLIDYKVWNLEKLRKFSKYLRDKSSEDGSEDEKTKLIKNQKIIDVESQIAFRNALEKYKKLIDENPENDLCYEKALVLDELKQYNEAIESLDEFLKNNPKNAKAWLKKGIILLKLTKYEESKNGLEKSIQYFKILIDENPGNPDHWYNRGTAHSSLVEVLIKTRDYQDSNNEYEEAVKAFDNATTLNPNFSLAWNNKGNAYLKLKKYNKAIEAFEEAFNINSNYYLALHNKGDALYSLGKYDEAKEIYDDVVYEDKIQNTERLSDPNVYKSWNDKGLALYKLERYYGAIEAFDNAIEINPTFADGWTNQGVVFYKLEMFPEAKRAFEGALKIDPGNLLASNNLGVVLARDGELDRAKKLFENTLKENPDFIFGHINLAELFLNNGGVERASEEIERTLDIVKNSNDSDMNLDYIYYLDGRIKIESQSKDKQIQSKDTDEKYCEAVKSFEKALSFNVEDPGLILWSVYAKYLCQKFEIGGKANSSEESKTNKEKTLTKTEDLFTNELYHSIISNLIKISNFCNLPMMKNNTLSQRVKQCSWFNIIFTFILVMGLAYLIKPVISKQSLSIFAAFPAKNATLITFLIMVVVFSLLCLILSFFLLGLFEKSFVFKSIYKPAFWVDQLLVFRIFKLEWIFENIKSYTKFILSNDKYPEQKIERQNNSDKPDILKLKPLIKIDAQLIKLDKYKEIEAYTLYLLGYFYFKLQDYTTAKEKLQECIGLKPDSKTDKAARELLANIWKHKIRPSFWTYWFNSPVKTWRRRAFGTFIILGILLILFVHAENPQPVAWNNSTSNDSKNFIPDQINLYPYIISYYPSNNTSSELTGSPSNVNNSSNNNTNKDGNETINDGDNNTNSSNNNTNKADNDAINDGGNNTTWNILTPTRVNIYPDIPMDNLFDALLLLILILILISPSIRITETVKMTLQKGIANVSLDVGPIETPPEFNFELTPSLMQDVIRRLDENL